MGAVLLKFIVMPVLKSLYFRHVFILSGLKDFIPVFVKLLVLVKVGILALLALLLMVKDHFLHLARVLLLLQFLDTVRSDLSLYVSSFRLTHCLVFLHGNPITQVNGYLKRISISEPGQKGRLLTFSSGVGCEEISFTYRNSDRFSISLYWLTWLGSLSYV